MTRRHARTSRLRSLAPTLVAVSALFAGFTAAGIAEPTQAPSIPTVRTAITTGAPGTAGAPAAQRATGASGSASDWAWLSGNAHARWNPCTPIQWAYDATGSYAGSRGDMAHALDLLAARTGLRFRYAGAMNYRAYETKGTVPAGVNVVIGWSNAKRDQRLSGTTVGWGSIRYTGTQDGRSKITSGAIVLDAQGRLRKGFSNSGPGTWGQVMTHEAGHVVGLNHARGKTQVMAPNTSSANHRFGAGDLNGLKHVGSSGGCVN